MIDRDVDADRFSVVIPAFNASSSLAASIASALHAGASEVVVVDDGSHDDTSAVARQAGATLVVRTENQGTANARRTGVLRVTCAQVIFCDADDILLKAGVGRSLHLLRRHGEASGVCAPTVAMRGDVRTGVIKPWAKWIGPADLIEKRRSFGPPACVVWRTAAVLDSFTAEPTALAPRFAEDYEFYIRMSSVSPILAHDEPACIYSAGFGKSFQSPKRDTEDTEQIGTYYAQYLGIVPPGTNGLRRAARALARQSFYSTNRPQKLCLLALAACLDPGRAFRSLAGRTPMRQTPPDPRHPNRTSQ